MTTRPDRDTLQFLADQLRSGPREVSEIERAAAGLANRHDLLTAALALNVRMRGAAARRYWELPSKPKEIRK